MKQVEYWNGVNGQKWVEFSDQLDRQLAPLNDLIIEKAALAGGERVLDVGCGAGRLSFDVLQSLHEIGSITGIDISKQLIELANKRCMDSADRITFLLADASSHLSLPKVDVIVSRLGVMFFEKPIAAFAQLRSNLNEHGRLVFVCWQSPTENEWAQKPLDIAKPHLKEPLPEIDFSAPGLFSLSDKERIRTILEKAGWKNINIESRSCKLQMPGNDLHECIEFITTLGPLGRAIQSQNADKHAITTDLARHFDTRTDGKERLFLSAKVWCVSTAAH